ncbi:MAG: DUF1778 domain-containing protein [Magnetococcus sp. YQC-9]
MTIQTTRSQKLDIRLTPAAKEAICAAAALKRRSVSEFVLDCALTRAEETLAERQRFSLDDAHWQAFQEALDAPARDLPRLQKLLQQPGPFATGEA